MQSVSDAIAAAAADPEEVAPTPVPVCPLALMSARL
jgi:hypothetical protein